MVLCIIINNMFTNTIRTIIALIIKTLFVPAFAFDVCQVNDNVNYAGGVHYYDGGCGSGCGCEDAE
ncbi:MAG: hypothetical protein COU30_05445 [Candidatus Magasanikbacteria bacterium CG10_big_fil_rev_8_21_14_0_10_38_6]|uniref:Uncharacterized protein n=1 Tax=Candidatus Magasanikbacteria bacterium CG10_big_fil_rev_8_21_14_0_10_38_6 TaxID=1974647 RepID=A0A2M6NZN4_9BACT|nr:MAG: hypothetical protein COU30_05445 [Candidatus Magasanikbacteria bacterium CG10_big_fil_rev_8_21_14_0_10_38_6]